MTTTEEEEVDDPMQAGKGEEDGMVSPKAEEGGQRVEVEVTPVRILAEVDITETRLLGLLQLQLLLPLLYQHLHQCLVHRLP